LLNSEESTRTNFQGTTSLKIPRRKY